MVNSNLVHTSHRLAIIRPLQTDGRRTTTVPKTPYNIAVVRQKDDSFPDCIMGMICLFYEIFLRSVKLLWMWAACQLLCMVFFVKAGESKCCRFRSIRVCSVTGPEDKNWCRLLLGRSSHFVGEFQFADFYWFLSLNKCPVVNLWRKKYRVPTGSQAGTAVNQLKLRSARYSSCDGGFVIDDDVLCDDVGHSFDPWRMSYDVMEVSHISWTRWQEEIYM